MKSQKDNNMYHEKNALENQLHSLRNLENLTSLQIEQIKKNES
jgi:hypothetical protein